MAERVIQSDSDKADVEKQVATPPNTELLRPAPPDTSSLSSIPTAISWTPRFIVVFFLTLVLALSAESLLTAAIMQGWIAPILAFLPHTLAALGLLFLLITRSRSLWLRVGGVFGCTWAIFACVSFFVNALALDPKSTIPLHLTAATNAALLGTSICFSIDHTLLHRWDNWFFRFVLIIAGCVVALVYFLLPNETRSSLSLETVIATVMLFLSLFVWWLRPSCWRAVPGPTFLFGLTPFILLLLAIPDFANTSDHFFFSQVAFLTLLLGILRTLQGERIIKL